MTGQKVTQSDNESAVRDEVADTLNLDPRDKVRDERVYVGPKRIVSGDAQPEPCTLHQAFKGMPLERVRMAAMAVALDSEDWTDEEHDALREFLDLGGNPATL